MRGTVILLTLGVAGACSQRVTPEEEYAAREGERRAAGVAVGDTAKARASGPELDSTLLGDRGPGAVRVTIHWPLGPMEWQHPSPSSPNDSRATLFVFVRPAGATTGPPLAVRAMTSASFPLTLGIGPVDAMISGTAFPDSVTVTARIDDDGIATTTGPYDHVATSGSVPAGGEVRLVLAPVGET